MPRYSSSRRSFLKTSLSVTAGSLLIAGTKATGDFRGSNEAIRVAVAGINGRGGTHIGEFADPKKLSEVTYLIDVDQRLFPAKLKSLENKGSKAPKTVVDVRTALDSKDVDVLTIATPNHWHALMVIWACQAGKDVYVEKPMSHNVHVGRIAFDTARKYNRIVQHGTQSRSNGSHERAMLAIRSGQLGKLLVSRGLCYKPGTPGQESTRWDIGTKAVENPPQTLDFNMWLGPAPEQPFHRNLVHYRWHWFWDFGNGDIGNQGVHEMDKARWALPPDVLYPRSVISFGGRFGPKDQGQVPNTQVALFDYGPGQPQVIFEVRGFKSKPYMGEGVGNVYHLESGVIRGSKYYPNDGGGKDAPLPKVDVPQRPGGGHFANFLAAVRSRKISDLAADIAEAHPSCNLIHWANASYRVGSEVRFNQKTQAFGDNKDAFDALARMEEHLRDEAKLPVDGLSYQLGKRLNIDPKTEMSDDEAANKILKPVYRKGFEVPDKV